MACAAEKKLTILNVAFPLADVSSNSVGGAEQILCELDRGLTQLGHESLVIAGPASKIHGRLIPTRAVVGPITQSEWHAIHESTRKAIKTILAQQKVDLVHLHGIDFMYYKPKEAVPSLATLHMPLSWYPDTVFQNPDNLFLNCVSKMQKKENLAVPVIENGIPRELLDDAVNFKKRDFAVCVGRICPEKGFHFALRAAKIAGISLLLAGQVFPFQEHQAYFETLIIPELDRKRRFIGPINFKKKFRVMASAKCLLITSTVPETSSLVAREALACGTPVVAFPQGALKEIILPGKTGFLVQTEQEMAEAIRACDSIRPADCREYARLHFSPEKMIASYVALYREILESYGSKSTIT